jgi:hypothetical protein
MGRESAHGPQKANRCSGARATCRWMCPYSRPERSAEGSVELDKGRSWKALGGAPKKGRHSRTTGKYSSVRRTCIAGFLLSWTVADQSWAEPVAEGVELRETPPTGSLAGEVGFRDDVSERSIERYVRARKAPYCSVDPINSLISKKKGAPSERTINPCLALKSPAATFIEMAASCFLPSDSQKAICWSRGFNLE